MCGKNGRIEASNSSISAAFFSASALVLTAACLATPWYSLYTLPTFGSGGGSCAAVFWLTFSTDCRGGATAAYAATASRLAAGSDTQVAYRAAASAGAAAIALLALSLLLSLVHVVSAAMHAHALRAGALRDALPCFARDAVGLTAEVLALLCAVAGFGCGWGGTSGLANAIGSGSTGSFGLLYYLSPGPAAAMAGLALVFKVVSCSCELGARCCCKGGDLTQQEQAGGGGVSIVLPGAFGPAAIAQVGAGGAVFYPPPQQWQQQQWQPQPQWQQAAAAGAPLPGSAYPQSAFPHSAQPPPAAAPPPGAAAAPQQLWVARTDGAGTNCAFCFLGRRA